MDATRDVCGVVALAGANADEVGDAVVFTSTNVGARGGSVKFRAVNGRICAASGRVGRAGP